MEAQMYVQYTTQSGQTSQSYLNRFCLKLTACILFVQNTFYHSKISKGYLGCRNIFFNTLNFRDGWYSLVRSLIGGAANMTVTFISSPGFKVNVSSLDTSLSAIFLFFCFSGSNKTKVESLSWTYKVAQYNLLTQFQQLQ